MSRSGKVRHHLGYLGDGKLTPQRSFPQVPERGGERGALLGGSAIAKKDNKVLSHLGGQRQRFQEESLLGTSVK